MPKLGVNIDHVATIRQARRTVEPDPVHAAVLCELAGCDSITVHLREDRRHISDRDVRVLKETLRVPMNLEMAATDEMVDIALAIKPAYVCLVPENRQEVTTEGGLHVTGGNRAQLQDAIKRLQAGGIQVSLFIDPDAESIRASHDLGAEMIELHTGRYAESWRESPEELRRLAEGTRHGQELGLIVNAGHGLTYWNVRPVAELPGMHELNIGHSIVSRAVLVGMERAVREMRLAMAGSPA
ncbi:MAG: pyridoxine 5'-phosphate synthase [Candidatus Sericytochromatia bacterium]